MKTLKMQLKVIEKKLPAVHKKLKKCWSKIRFIKLDRSPRYSKNKTCANE